MRFRRALDRGNVTEALSAASELPFVALAEALELTLLLADREPEKYERAATRWHARFHSRDQRTRASQARSHDRRRLSSSARAAAARRFAGIAERRPSTARLSRRSTWGTS